MAVSNLNGTDATELAALRAENAKLRRASFQQENKGDGSLATQIELHRLKKEQQAAQAAGRGLLPQHRPPHELPLVPVQQPDRALLQSPDAGPRGLPPQRVISVNSNKRTAHRIVARCSLIKLFLLVVLI